MNKLIAIYDREEDVINSINDLSQVGFSPTELKVIAKRKGHFNQIEEKTDVHLDELEELVLARSVRDDAQEGDAGLFGGFVGAGSAVSLGGSLQLGSVPYAGVGVIAPDLFNFGTNYEQALSVLGLTHQEAKRCVKTIENDGFVVVVEDKEHTVNDEGVKFWRLGSAEAVFRSNGARDIW